MDRKSFLLSLPLIGLAVKAFAKEKLNVPDAKYTHQGMHFDKFGRDNGHSWNCASYNKNTNKYSYGGHQIDFNPLTVTAYSDNLNSVDNQVFKTNIYKDNILDGLRKHEAEITDCIINSKFYRHKTQDGIDFICMSGFMEQYNRYPNPTDHFTIIRGGYFFHLRGVPGNLYFYSEVSFKVTINKNPNSFLEDNPYKTFENAIGDEVSFAKFADNQSLVCQHSNDKIIVGHYVWTDETKTKVRFEEI